MNHIPRLLLYTRSYCHLCEEMQGRIEKLKPRYSFKLEIRDVDKEERWVEAYDALVPVLLLDGDEVCHYHLDDAKLRRLLESA